MSEAAGLLDDEVDGFGAAVGGASGLEVPGTPCATSSGAAEPGGLGDRAAVDDLGKSTPGGRVALSLEASELLGALPGHQHLEVAFVGLDRRAKAGLLGAQ